MMYALDTNIIIFLLNEDKNIERKISAALRNDDDFVIPIVVDYEVRRGLLCQPSANKERIYGVLRKTYGLGVMRPQMWQESVNIYFELRKKGFEIGDCDIFIAAFCLFNDYPLITRNIKHFENIAGLRCFNWVD
ncbi:MAG: PIN domain-containing protein [Turicibacter sp.]|nr:PIN domain-containing protein [Turicibacter sp.]